MRESGKLIAAGPFGDEGDLRGVYIFRVGSLEDAQALAETDPSVVAGRLFFELHPWWVKKGTFNEQS
jgi:uncharacterized protein YciI